MFLLQELRRRPGEAAAAFSQYEQCRAQQSGFPGADRVYIMPLASLPASPHVSPSVKRKQMS